MDIKQSSDIEEEPKTNADADISADDIFTEIRRLRDRNVHLQEHLDRIFGISSAIIYVLDADGRFVFINRGVEDILNFSTEELIGKHFSIILPPDEYQRVGRDAVLPKLAGRKVGPDDAPKLFDERRRRERRTRNMEIRLLSRRIDSDSALSDDVIGVVEVEGAYSLIDDSAANGGKREVFVGSQGVIFDITKYKQTELERLEIHKRLFHIQKMDAIGRLSGKIAHDLNNKLGSIIGIAEIIKQDAQSDFSTVSANIDVILSASKHAMELSNMLYKFSRKGESPFERLNFHKLLNNIMAFAGTIAGSSVSVQKNLNSANPMIIGSETALQGAMLNIIMNALEAMKNISGATLTVETNDVPISAPFKTFLNSVIPIGDYLLVSVRDTGVGMDEVLKKKIFEPFFTTNDEKGLGLGLTSIRECVRNHGGIMNLESDLGKGSKFDIYLPYADER